MLEAGSFSENAVHVNVKGCDRYLIEYRQRRIGEGYTSDMHEPSG